MLSRLQISYYPASDSHIMDKVKEVLELSSYSSKIELDDATAVDTSNLAAKRVFLQRIKKVVNVIWIIFFNYFG